jgi:hypothetical protein
MSIPEHLQPYYDRVNETRQEYITNVKVPSTAEERASYHNYLSESYHQSIEYLTAAYQELVVAHPDQVDEINRQLAADNEYLLQWYNQAYELDYQPVVTNTVPVEVPPPSKTKKESLLKRVQKVIDSGKLLDVSKYASEEKTAIIARPTSGKSSKLGSEWLPIVSNNWNSYYAFMRQLLEDAIAQYGNDNYECIAHDLFPVMKNALINFGCFQPSNNFVASDLIFEESERFSNQRVPCLFQSSAVIPNYPAVAGYGSSTFA